MAWDIKKQLIEIADAVNSFDSPAVQVIVVERVLDQLMELGNKGIALDGVATVKEKGLFLKPVAQKEPVAPKPQGSTKLLRELFNSGYFVSPRSIGEVADYFNANFNGVFYTYQLSGLLLGLFKSGKLKREVDGQTNRFVYVNA